MSEKLQKLLAHAGYGSRREIERWIADGKISLNGKRAKLGERATAADRILINGKLVQLKDANQQRIKAILYHKPEGQIVSRDDPNGRESVFDHLPALPEGRWIAVGRLDLNTSGLLLFTNHGGLANHLMHPSSGLEREYLARVRGVLSSQSLKKLVSGELKLDGHSAAFDRVLPADEQQEGSNHWYRVIIREGRYREVRRLFAEVNHPVSRLKRIRYGTVKLGRDVRRGQSKLLAPKQLRKLAEQGKAARDILEQIYPSQRR